MYSVLWFGYRNNEFLDRGIAHSNSSLHPGVHSVNSIKVAHYSQGMRTPQGVRILWHGKRTRTQLIKNGYRKRATAWTVTQNERCFLWSYARKEIVRKPKAVDITGFFKKFCIATHTGKAPGFSKKSGAFPAFNRWKTPNFSHTKRDKNDEAVSLK